MDFKARLLEELGELNGKLYLLRKYIDENPEDETELERKQEVIMMDYISVLEQRLMKFMK